MSYDYTALVTTLSNHRTRAAAAPPGTTAYREHLQEGLQVYDTLSGHCPLTPLLWMQYAYDIAELMVSFQGDTATNNDSDNRATQSPAARQTRIETLALGLHEFPGSAILQLHYCELLVEDWLLQPVDDDQDDDDDEPEEERQANVQNALDKALQQVGRGSHRNDGDIVAQLYRLHAFVAARSSTDAALASWCERARTPLDDANDTLGEELRDFGTAVLKTASLPSDWGPALEQARRWEAKTFASLRSSEDDITAAMHQEGIAWKGKVDLVPPLSFSSSTEATTTTTTTTSPKSLVLVTTTEDFCATVLRGTENPRYYWNGYGGAATAQAFLQYAAAGRKFRFPKDDNDEDEGDDQDQAIDSNNNSKEDLSQKHQQLILSIFERGVAECPTVEALWLAYIKHLTWLLKNVPNLAPSSQSLKDVTKRAVRNCPFSLALVQQQLHVALLLANQPPNDRGESVLDPDELLQIVTLALDSKFLPHPSQTYDLFTTAIRVIQRRILVLLATSTVGHDPHRTGKNASIPTVLQYDDAELTPSKIPKPKKSDATTTRTVAPPLDDETWTEVQDLCEEVRDMLDEATKRLNQDHASWTEGRSMLAQERAQMERLVVAPLLGIRSLIQVGPSPGGDAIHNGAAPGSDDPLSHLEKAVRLHNPPHPDTYRMLIEHVLHHGTSVHKVPASSRSPGDVVSRLRQVRGLYQKAIRTVGPARVKDDPTGQRTVTSGIRDFETALACLCHEYQQFERLFGSEQSLADATRAIQKKVQKTAHHRKNQQSTTRPTHPTGEAPVDTMLMDLETSANKNQSTKRKASDAEAGTAPNPAAKKRKTEAGQEEKPGEEAPKMQPGQHHRVQVGSVLHRAHPYTVRISNLAVKTGEMDLLETFRKEHKCGHLVHVRVMREKPFHAKGKEAKHGVSKGCALMQFEEKASVEKMIELNDKVELHGKTLRIERSHVPAVGIVPPGMHRAGGRHRQETVEEQSQDGDKKDKNGSKAHGDDSKTPVEAPAKPAEAKKKPVGVLGFRPRAVGPKKQRPKAKFDLK